MHAPLLFLVMYNPNGEFSQNAYGAEFPFQNTGMNPNLNYRGLDANFDRHTFGDTGFGHFWEDLTGQSQATSEFLRQDYFQTRAEAFAREQQQREFDYNSPQNQINMMVAAGLNPALMSDGFVSGSSGASPSSSVPSSSFSAPFSSLVSQANPLLGNIITAAKARAEIGNINADTDQKRVSTHLMPLDFNVRNKIADATVKQLEESANLSHENAEMIKREQMFFDDTYQTKIETANAILGKMSAEISNLKEMNKNIRKEREVMDADIALKSAQTEEAYSQAFLNGEIQTNVYDDSRLKEQLYNAIDKYGEGLPFSVDLNQRIIMLAKNGRVDEAKSMIQGLQVLYSRMNDAQVNSSYKNLWKKYVIGFGKFNPGLLEHAILGKSASSRGSSNYYDDDSYFDYFDR